MGESVPPALAAAIEYRLRNRGTAGCAIAAFDRDEVLFSGGVGYADVASGRPVAASTVFRVGSISKLLVTTLITKLADDGALDLDRSVNDYLPAELQIAATDEFQLAPTLRALLSHSSGIPAGVRGVDAGNRVLTYAGNQGRVPDLRAAVTGLAMAYEPGTRVVYSNPAFNVLGAVAADLSDAEFESVISDEVLQPLGMSASRFCSERSGPEVATHYGNVVPPSAGTSPVRGFRLVATPMGGLTTSVADLARFGQMVLRAGDGPDSTVLQPDTLRAATTIGVTNHPALDQGYGLGFKVRPWRGRTVVGHDGNMPGVSSQMIISPADGIGVVVLTNGFALAVPHEVAELAMEGLLGLEHAPVDTIGIGGAERRRRAAFGRSVEGTYRLRDTSPPGVLGRLNDLTVRINVTHDAGGRLRVEGNPGSDGPMWLIPDGENDTYRIASGVDHGANAVIERRDDGVHLWFGFAQHLFRK